MHNEELLKNHRQLHRLAMAIGFAALLFVSACAIEKSIDIFVYLSLMDCSFG